MSGPPISKIRFDASGAAIACAKYSATSSIQIGCERCRPGPITVTTGEYRTCFTNVRNAPPPGPKMKLGRKITCSSPEPATACSSAHFAA